MYLKIYAIIISFLCIPGVFSQEYTVTKIWDAATHNAFTDLIRYNGKYYCTFREGGNHEPSTNNPVNGKIRILVSEDGALWKSVALIEKDGVDLRDSKLSESPDGRLMILMGGSIYSNGKLTSRYPQVAFMDSQGTFTDLIQAHIDPHIRSHIDWLWRVTWDKETGVGYGVVYQFFGWKQEWEVYLLRTKDGVNYQSITQLDITGQPNEATVELLEGDKMRVVVRRESGDKKGKMGYSSFPYRDWQWYDLGIRLGGPDMITLPNGKTLIGSRDHSAGDSQARTGLFMLDENNRAVKVLELPSDGDTSYPGFLVVDDELWVSYYSSHEGKSSIYLAKIKLTLFNAP
ncbi:MAG: hypothetical protein LBQ60_19030 [Bacteroidales bacterium]|jgi:hypothetical protein|nr:hypothetical protein [Bacteroidales bacterium]